MIETSNAIITKVRLEIEDHGILTAWLDLDYGGCCQSFGGYFLDAKGANYCAVFVRKCLDIGDVSEWNKLVGKTVRVKFEHIKVHSIGHIIKDEWFNPSEVFEKMERKAKK